MNFNKFIEELHFELSNPLPGEQAHLQMASQRRIKELENFPKKDLAVKSSVLVLLYPRVDDEICLVLMQRPKYDGVHSGQISLPGGKAEIDDEDLAATAIRETEEEFGVPRDEIRIIGSLSELYIPPSNFIVYPFVGYCNVEPKFSPDPQEVEEIIEVKVKDLIMDEKIKRKDIVVHQNIKINAPYFDINDKTIWGATAMILSEFRNVLLKVYSTVF